MNVEPDEFASSFDTRKMVVETAFQQAKRSIMKNARLPPLPPPRRGTAASRQNQDRDAAEEDEDDDDDGDDDVDLDDESEEEDYGLQNAPEGGSAYPPPPFSSSSSSSKQHKGLTALIDRRNIQNIDLGEFSDIEQLDDHPSDPDELVVPRSRFKKRAKSETADSPQSSDQKRLLLSSLVGKWVALLMTGECGEVLSSKTGVVVRLDASGKHFHTMRARVFAFEVRSLSVPIMQSVSTFCF